MHTFARTVQHSSSQPSILSRGLGVAAASLLVLALAATTAGAQSTVPLPLASLAEGARVRIKAAHGTAGMPSDAAIIGTVRRVTADSLTFVAEASTPITLPLTQIARLDASEGRRRRGNRGMGVGFAVGALSGGLLGYSGGDGYIFTKGEAALFGAAVFGALGTVAGGLIGLTITTDAWRPVAIGAMAGRVSVRPVLGPAATGLSVRLTW